MTLNTKYKIFFIIAILVIVAVLSYTLLTSTNKYQPTQHTSPAGSENKRPFKFPLNITFISKSQAINNTYYALTKKNLSDIEIISTSLDKYYIVSWTSEYIVHFKYIDPRVSINKSYKGIIHVDPITGRISSIYLTSVMRNKCPLIGEYELSEEQAIELIRRILVEYNYSSIAYNNDVDFEIINIYYDKDNRFIEISYLLKIYGYIVYHPVGGGKIYYDPCLNETLFSISAEIVFLYEKGFFKPLEPAIDPDQALEKGINQVENSIGGISDYETYYTEVIWSLKDVDDDNRYDLPTIAYMFKAHVVTSAEEFDILLIVDAINGELIYYSRL